MLTHYFKTAWRNLSRNTAYTGINILGLSVGMAVALLIGLWIRDELSYNKANVHYPYIAQVMRHSTANGEIRTRTSMPVPLKHQLISQYPGQFDKVVLTTPSDGHVIAAADKQMMETGRFMEPGATDLLALHMVKGSANLNAPSAVLLSESLAERLFGTSDPIGRRLKIDNKMQASVTGVYRDVSYHSRFSDLSFVAPWRLYVANNDWAQKAEDNWGINSFELYVQVHPEVNMPHASGVIKNVERDIMGPRASEVFLFPMSRWHLHATWRNGVNAGGRIESVWLFGLISVFVLLLACINFMNLSTARSEKRAKEVGVRKAIGSSRSQLIRQFYMESFLAAFLAFILALGITGVSLPFFNTLAGKEIALPWTNVRCWAAGMGFILFTGLMAGSYPALYLSSFRPVRILTGTFHAGRLASLPRRILVVLQFTVSAVLAIGTLVVYQQIQFAKERPVGYSRNGLLTIRMTTPELKGHGEAFRADLLRTGAVTEAAESQGPTTEVWDNRSGFTWPGKDPEMDADFATIAVTRPYGKTVGWTLAGGRDFSIRYPSDMSSSIIVNETAARFMGLKQPVGSTITWGGEPLQIIGVINDMVMSSPYEPVKPTVFYLNRDNVNFIIMRINPAMSMQHALSLIGPVFKRYAPGMPFDYTFVDEDYARKFASELRMGRLAGVFALLASFISCLGLLGLVAFVAERRTKEIGIRKVLGASTRALLLLLSGEFMALVALAMAIASPVSWLLMNRWLQGYTYRTAVPWWIFLLVGISAMVIVLGTIGFQAAKAAAANPVKSLRSE